MKKRTMLILSGTAALLAGIIFFSPDGKGERPRRARLFPQPLSPTG